MDKNIQIGATALISLTVGFVAGQIHQHNKQVAKIKRTTPLVNNMFENLIEKANDGATSTELVELLLDEATFIQQVTE